MINREDMLELTRRMTPARTSFVRMAGCYTDSDGEYVADADGAAGMRTEERCTVGNVL